MRNRKKIDSFISFGSIASVYGKQYDEKDYKSKYPANRCRLNIVISILKKIKPKRILDVGCGSGQPLIEILNNGFNAKGFDRAKKMVEEAKKNLKKARYPEDLVQRNNMENIKGFKPGEFDCIIALGSVYYARNFNKTLKNITKLLRNKGHFIFSLRNELFSLFSLNKYSLSFFWQELMTEKLLSDKTKKKVWKFLSERFKEEKVKHKFKTIDDLNIHSIYHNPLTIEQEILMPYNLGFKDLFFYHYHSMPPIFEHSIPEEYRKTSAKLENPKDWRGLFMASAFIVHACKKR